MGLSATNSSVQSRTFGVLDGGEPVTAWQLTVEGGLLLECISYGGIVTRLMVPDRDGRVADVVLGFNDLTDYVSGSAYLGAMIGRVAGRIPGARYQAEGILHKLSRNGPTNHLHGGFQGFDKKNWQGTLNERPDGAPSVCLHWTSPNGDEGYPGTVNVKVTYTVTYDNVFLIETEATTDRATPVSLTHHSYFNLAGESHGSIEDHLLEIHADDYVPVDEEMNPQSRLQQVINPGNDFRVLTPIRDALPHLFRQHGDLYRLRGNNELPATSRMVPAARLIDPASGRALEVSTSERYLQFYTGVSLDGTLVGKSGARYAKYGGLCLECEGYPDGATHPELGNILLQPGEKRREMTAYSFSNTNEWRER